MLVLSRKMNETIVIGDSITVTVLRIAGSQVKIGVEAPKSVSIRRGEIPDFKKGATKSCEHRR